MGNGLDGDTLWIVAEHGHHASYVQNIEANPRVRVKIGRRWRTGTAKVLLDDDPRARLDRIGSRVALLRIRRPGDDRGEHRENAGEHAGPQPGDHSPWTVLRAASGQRNRSSLYALGAVTTSA